MGAVEHTERFHAGDRGEIHGVLWRVVRGKKAPGDLRLELLVPRWTPVSMKVHALAADFYAENEGLLQRAGAIKRRVGYAPGEKFVEFIRESMRNGWTAACIRFDQERQEAQRRRLQVVDVPPPEEEPDLPGSRSFFDNPDDEGIEF